MTYCRWCLEEATHFYPDRLCEEHYREELEANE